MIGMKQCVWFFFFFHLSFCRVKEFFFFFLVSLTRSLNCFIALELESLGLWLILDQVVQRFRGGYKKKKKKKKKKKPQSYSLYTIV